MHRAILAAALLLSASSVASAHATLEKTESPSGGYKAVIRIGHGCDGEATQALEVRLPEGFVNAHPMPKPGWQLAVAKGDYAKTYSLHGSEVRAGALSVSWSGGELSDDFYDEFVLSGSLQGEPGTVLSFLVTQRCATKSVAWDQIAAPGEDPHALERPAPSVTILAGDGGEHHHEQAASGEGMVGDLAVSAGWARAMLPGQKAGGGYLTVENRGTAPDRLVSVSSADGARVEIHSMTTENDVMVMRPVPEGLEVPAGGKVELAPGGFHLMFLDVAKPFADGDTVPVQLRFEHAGMLDLALPVRKSAAGSHQH